jgi:hypothetical protein
MYIVSVLLTFSNTDSHTRPPVPIKDTLCFPNEGEPMYIKYSVSLIKTGGLAYLPEGGTGKKQRLCTLNTVYFDRYARPPVLINATLCLMYIGSASLGFSLCTLNTVYH